MLGPLPKIHTVVLAAASVVLFVLVGAWVARATTLLLPPWGTILGAAAGVLVAFLLLHNFHHGQARQQVTTRR